MLGNLPNIKVEKNFRNGLVQYFIKDGLETQRSKVIFQSQIISGR